MRSMPIGFFVLPVAETPDVDTFDELPEGSVTFSLSHELNARTAAAAKTYIFLITEV